MLPVDCRSLISMAFIFNAQFFIFHAAQKKSTTIYVLGEIVYNTSTLSILCEDTLEFLFPRAAVAAAGNELRGRDALFQHSICCFAVKSWQCLFEVDEFLHNHQKIGIESWRSRVFEMSNVKLIIWRGSSYKICQYCAPSFSVSQ